MRSYHFIWLLLLVLFTPHFVHARVHWIGGNTFEVSNIRVDRPDARWRVVELPAPGLVKMLRFRNGPDTQISLTWQPPLEHRLSLSGQQGRRGQARLKKFLTQELHPDTHTITAFSIAQNWIYVRSQGAKSEIWQSFRFADATLKGPYIKIEMHTPQRGDHSLAKDLEIVENSLVVTSTPLD